MLIDMLPHETEPYFYIVANRHRERTETYGMGVPMCMADGTDELLRAHLLWAWGDDDGCPRHEILDFTSELEIHMPLMVRQNERISMMDVFGGGLRNIEDMSITSMEGSCLLVGATMYARNMDHVSVSHGTQLRLRRRDGTLAFTVKYESDVIAADGLPLGKQAAARFLLDLFVWSEETLASARGRFASKAFLPRLYVALAAGFGREDDRPLWSALITRLGGVSLKHDKTKDPQHAWWVWHTETLWTLCTNRSHVVEHVQVTARTLLQIARQLGEQLHPDMDIARRLLCESTTLHESLGKPPGCKKKGGGDDAESDGGGGDDGGDEPVFDVKKECAALCAHLRSGRCKMLSRMDDRFHVERVITSITPWVGHPYFEEATAKCRSVAFLNGVQDMKPPYDFRPSVTQLDLLTYRLQYTVAPPAPCGTVEYAELERLVLDRYNTWFEDDDVSKREADKDAVSLLANPAVMPEANIRMHLGPYSSTVKHFRGRNGKNMRLSMLKSVYGPLLKSTDASFLTMKKRAGQAYSFLEKIDTQRIMWVEEAQQTNEGGRLAVWNTATLLLFAPGGEANTIDIRREYGASRELVSAIQNVNVAFNQVRIPESEGIWNKSEVSPYTKVARPRAEIERLKREDGEDAYTFVVQEGSAQGAYGSLKLCKTVPFCPFLHTTCSNHEAKSNPCKLELASHR